MWVSLVAGAFLAFAGAFGTGEAPVDRRLAFWLPTMLVGGLVGGLISRLVSRRSPNQSPWRLWAVVSLAVTGPLTLVVWIAGSLAFGDYGPRNLPMLLPPVAIVSAAMTAIFLLARPPVVVTHDAPAPAPRARFLDRLPPKLLGAELHAVEAHDHYLRLHTSKGADLILMRLSDAVVELEGLEGAQVHRSWWVARASVESVRREDGAVRLVLKGGVEAPVSRSNVKALREAGWL